MGIIGRVDRKWNGWRNPKSHEEGNSQKRKLNWKDKWKEESKVVITKGFFSQSTKRCGIVVESDSASLEGSYSDHFA